jgi:hypothetical protein
MKRVLWLGCLLLAGPVLGEEAAKIPENAAKVVARINELRKLAGLDPVTYDASMSWGCYHHAEYLVAHDAEVWADDSFDAHDELKGAKFTEDGKAAAKKSVIAWGSPNAEAVDNHFNGLYHRVPFLDPRLKSVGVGEYLGTKYSIVSVIDVLSGVDDKIAWSGDRAIVYPTDKQRGIPVELGDEMPCPIPEDPDKKGGYPVTVTFPKDTKVTEVRATLKVQGGADLPAWVSTPEAPADKRYQRNTICLITKDVLSNSKVHIATVEAKVDGKDWKKTWAFATAAAEKKK